MLHAAVCCALLCVVAAVRAAGDADPTSEAAARVLPFPGEDLTAAVRFERDRALEELLERAAAAVARGDTADAVSFLKDVLETAGPRLVVVDGTFVSAAAEANRRLAELPGDRRALYERLVGDTVRVAVAHARESGDWTALKRLGLQYRHTEAGRRALRDFALASLDQGRFVDAALACDALVSGSPNPDLEVMQDPALAVAWCAALLEQHQVAAARAIRERFASPLARAAVPGRGLTAAAEIDRLLAREAAAEPPSVFAAEPPRPTEELLLTSVMPPHWSVPLLPESQQAVLERGLRPLADASVPTFAHLRPIVLPAGIACRTWDAVMLLDSRSGVQLWRHELPGPSAPAAETPAPSDRLMGLALRRVMGDGAHTAISGDAMHVYCVLPNRAPPPIAPVAGVARPAANTLVALRVTDGELAWALGDGAGQSDAPPAPAASVAESAARPFFHGPPTTWGAQLLVLAEQSGLLSLLMLDPHTGQTLHSVPLCTTEVALGRDDRRLAQASPVTVIDGTALCPTAGGALVAVDLFSESIRWAFRYPRDRLRPFNREAPLTPTRQPQVLWADGWREVGLAADGPHVVLTSGESEHLFVLEMHTGRLLWSQPREDGLYLAAVQDGLAVVSGRGAVRAYRLANGQLAWRAPLEEIAGRGCLVGGQLLVPLADGCVAAIRLADGNLTRTFGTGSKRMPVESAAEPPVTVPVSLAWTPAGVVAQSLTRLWRARTLADAEQFPDGLAELEALLQRAELQRERGAFAVALDSLEAAARTAGDGHRAAVHARIVLAALEWIVSEPARCEEIVRRVSGFAESDQQRVALEWQRFCAAVDRALDEGLGSACRLYELGCERYYFVRGSAGRVRMDRAVQARLLAALEGLEPPARAAAEARLTERLEACGEAAAEPRLADFWDHFRVGQQARLARPPHWSSVGELGRAQLRLLQQSRIAEPPLAAGALVQLAQLYASRSDPRDAAAVYRQLHERHADAVLPDGTTVQSVLEAAVSDPAIAACLQRVDEWPTVRPAVSSRLFPEGEIYFVPVAVECASGGLFERLNVAVHRLGSPQGQPVRFSGGGMRRPWALMLPTKDNPLRSSQSHPDLRRAWGFGQLLVLQVGSDVFGIAPFNAAGEPEATIVWPPSGRSISTGADLAAAPVPEFNVAPAIRVSPFDERIDRQDEFGHLVGRVGPVRPGYFCVQRRGAVIAHDTATGEELWRWSGVGPGVRCYGDDRHVVLHDVAHARMSVHHAVDGSLVEERAAPLQLAGLLKVFGCDALLEATDPGAPPEAGHRLTSFDVARFAENWSRTFPRGSVCFPVDERWFGVLEVASAQREPAGPESGRRESTEAMSRLHFLSLDDGRTLASHPVTVPRPLVHLRTIIDEHRIIVVLSGMRMDEGLEAATRGGGIHSNESFRRIIVNGPWYAFDRSTGEPLWCATLDNASLLLDQPVDVPILVCNELRYPADRIGQGALVGRVRCFDRRSGDLLYDDQVPAVHTYFLVERDVDEHWVELRLPGRVVRFDYGEGTGTGD